MSMVYKYNWDKEKLMKEEQEDLVKHPEFENMIRNHYMNMYQVFQDDYFSIPMPKEKEFDLRDYLLEQLELFKEYKENMIVSQYAVDELKIASFFLDDGMYFPLRYARMNITNEQIVDACRQIYRNLDLEIYSAIRIPLYEDNIIHMFTSKYEKRTIAATCHTNHSNHNHYISVCKDGDLSDIASLSHELYHYYEAQKRIVERPVERSLYTELGSTYMGFEACEFLENQGYDKILINDIKGNMINSLNLSSQKFYLTMQMLGYLGKNLNMLDDIKMHDIEMIASQFVLKPSNPLSYFDAYNIKKYQYINGFVLANTLRMQYPKKDQIRVLKEISSNLKHPMDVLKDNNIDISRDNHLENAKQFILTI